MTDIILPDQANSFTVSHRPYSATQSFQCHVLTDLTVPYRPHSATHSLQCHTDLTVPYGPYASHRMLTPPTHNLVANVGLNPRQTLILSIPVSGKVSLSDKPVPVSNIPYRCNSRWYREESSKADSTYRCRTNFDGAGQTRPVPKIIVPNCPPPLPV